VTFEITLNDQATNKKTITLLPEQWNLATLRQIAIKSFELQSSTIHFTIQGKDIQSDEDLKAIKLVQDILIKIK